MLAQLPVTNGTAVQLDRHMEEPLKSLVPPTADSNTLWYLGVVAAFGGLAALAALLGDADKKITSRVLFAYIISGAVAGGATVFLLYSTLGFSYTSIGVSILAGFKAVDVLSVGGNMVSIMVRKFFGGDEKDKNKPSNKDEDV
jgi:hypothetical protein